MPDFFNILDTFQSIYFRALLVAVPPSEPPLICPDVSVSQRSVSLFCAFFRGECTESLRRRISELETECKKLTLDIKVKEDLIRELELKVQASTSTKVHTDPKKKKL